MGRKKETPLTLWRFFTKFVGAWPIRPPSDLPEKATNANLSHGFSPVSSIAPLRHNHFQTVDNHPVIPNVHRVFHTPPVPEIPGNIP